MFFDKTKLLVGGAGLLMVGAVAFFSFSYAHLRGEVARLNKENQTLVESILQADATMSALQEQAGGCMTELAEARKSCDARLLLWKQAKTVPRQEAPDDILDQDSSDAYTRSIDSMFDRLRK